MASSHKQKTPWKKPADCWPRHCWNRLLTTSRLKSVSSTSKPTGRNKGLRAKRRSADLRQNRRSSLKRKKKFVKQSARQRLQQPKSWYGSKRRRDKLKLSSSGKRRQQNKRAFSQPAKKPPDRLIWNEKGKLQSSDVWQRQRPHELRQLRMNRSERLPKRLRNNALPRKQLRPHKLRRRLPKNGPASPESKMLLIWRRSRPRLTKSCGTLSARLQRTRPKPN
mmetsp:Transcript_48494/g.71890  ORF Transcript_48494/g.71890 Transcript_48494/m.71890 type:complete len:222 (+) Transcript_48494:796-1461(+)